MFGFVMNKRRLRRILAAVLMGVSVTWRTSNGWMFFTMFAMTFAGGAMMMRELFRSK